MKMRHHLALLAMVFSALFLFNACAVQGTPPPAFDPQPISSGKWQQKADYLYFILDASSSMDAAYKLETARGVVAHFDQTMPKLDLTVALRTFGHDNAVSLLPSDLMVKPQAYAPKVLGNGAAKVARAGGYSPLGSAIKDAMTDLANVKSRIAMVIVSDGEDMAENPIGAAKALKEGHDGRICIYTVQVGNSPEGQQFLTKLAQATDCGRAVTAADVAGGAGMNAFVKEVLLGGPSDSDGDGVADDKDRCPNTPRGVTVDKAGCPLDSDRDGVLDYKDKCPGTPAGTKVDQDGCPVIGKVTAAGTYILEGVQFESNKADLKASSYSVLNNVAEIMKQNAALNVEIQGHTDASGNHDYNVKLSQRRAETVKAYLESRGIEGSRMTAKGYGPDAPIDTNATKEGRARNRRVEFKPIQ